MGRTPNASKQTHAVLREMLRTPQEWRHGYGLSQDTELKSGTLYPLLIRLKEQGFLEARWEEAERAGTPPRHVYRLTPSGIAFARSLEPQDIKRKLRPKLSGSFS